MNVQIIETRKKSTPFESCKPENKGILIGEKKKFTGFLCLVKTNEGEIRIESLVEFLNPPFFRSLTLLLLLSSEQKHVTTEGHAKKAWPILSLNWNLYFLKKIAKCEIK